ncbi:hypothetical protein Dda_6443 [Drechslerella dactyloides]|uniref:Uncharacterized protein n=1 Tax=Drechslerella dactyloides TaxID=74499 RepID=A0AAD6ITU3_DREDA|nr:hypothetical protein Dda_6443 [Drechslerella dactyloides]
MTFRPVCAFRLACPTPFNSVRPISCPASTTSTLPSVQENPNPSSSSSIAATARGSCSGGPSVMPKTRAYVAAKNMSRSCSIVRKGVGVSVSRVERTVGVAGTVWVRSSGISLILPSRAGSVKIEDADSGSHCIIQR